MDHVKYHTRFVVEKSDHALDPFERTVNATLPSVVAIAVGTHSDGVPKVIGSGFGLSTNPEDREAKFIATCWHTAEEAFKISKYNKAEMKDDDLIDKEQRIILLEDDKPTYIKHGLRFSYLKGNADLEYVKQHDVCMCIPGDLKIPPLRISSDKLTLGREVAIIGFPTIERLQRIAIQPFIMRSIISSILNYKFEKETDGKTAISERIAIACDVGGGFSGGPVISSKDGKVVGMIDYLPSEIDIVDIKLTKSEYGPIEGDVRHSYPAGISLAVPAMRIKQCFGLASNLNQKYVFSAP